MKTKKIALSIVLGASVACSGAVDNNEHDTDLPVTNNTSSNNTSGMTSNNARGPDDFQGLVINELAAKVIDGDGMEQPDWIELYNTSDVAISLDGVTISDKDDEPDRGAFPDGILVPAKGFYTIDLDFGLSSGNGDKALLYAPNGELIDSTEFGADTLTEANAWGRFPDGTGNFSVLGSQTKNTPNMRGSSNNMTPVDYTALKINELAASVVDGDGMEQPDWVELYNTSDLEIPLTGVTISDKDDEIDRGAFPDGAVIPANGYIVLDLDFGLSSTNGETVKIYDPMGTELDSATFGAGELDETNALGRVPDGTSDFQVLEERTRGAANSANMMQGMARVVINEIDADGDPEDWVELYNAGDAAADLTGWYIVDANFLDPVEPDMDARYDFEAGTMIPAGGYLVLERNVTFSFGLGKSEDTVAIFDGDKTKVDEVAWTEADGIEFSGDASYGRASDGAEDFSPFATGTRGQANE